MGNQITNPNNIYLGRKKYFSIIKIKISFEERMQKDQIYAGYNLLHSTMVNQKQKGQSDGSDSDWTLCRTNLLLDICSFYPGFSLEVVFQFLNDKISIFSWFGVHNPLKSFPKPHRPN